MLVFYAVSILTVTSLILCDDTVEAVLRMMEGQRQPPKDPKRPPQDRIRCRKFEEPTDCADYHILRPLDPSNKIKCVPGCKCIDNYIRNRRGQCVPIKRQPGKPDGPVKGTPIPIPAQIVCGENQVASSCADNYAPFPHAAVCKPGCRCIAKYTRNSYDECVPIPPVLRCGKNEEAAACKQVCPPLSCSWDPTKMACRPGPCRPGCNCIKGYLQNDKGVCIPEGQCPIIPECPENEEYTDCYKNLDLSDPSATLTVRCRPCQCIEGYVRDKNGVCVTKEQLCERDRNSTYTLCPNRCVSTCQNPNGICSSECREAYGCGCKPGYLQCDNRCILPQDCPGGNPCKENQVFVYCNAGCPTLNCPQNDKLGQIACDPPRYCPSGCACKKNYKWDSDKRQKCILASECPRVNCTRENEEWNSCPASCFSDQCRDLKQVCRDTGGERECNPRCVCKYNYRRDDSGKCVPISKCPSTCGENEEPSECSDNYPRPVAGDHGAVEGIRCVPGCRCKKGYKRNSKGVCVLTEAVCGKYEETNFCIALAGIYCPPCRCKKGYKYDSNGECVLDLRCGENEEALHCKQFCPPDTCSSDPTRLDCRQPSECEAGCNCRVGYKRDENGICIPEEKCPQFCKGDRNATYTDCPSRCFTCNKANAICTKECRPKGCQCNTGYYRTDDGICVLPEDCPPIPCGRNETYAKCQFSCPTNYCPRDDSLNQVACSPPKPCLGGCVCNRNYLRTNDKQERCILASECPRVTCTRENEEWKSCPAPCFSDQCRDLKQAVCRDTGGEAKCNPRCVCKYNYRRDDSGKCVPITQCSSVCGEYEEPSECSDNNPRPVAGDHGAVEGIKCVPGCRCKKGYKRNSKGVCVLNLQCGENEEALHCKRFCPSDSCSSDATRMDCRQPVECEPGCNCKKGYKRDENGICILEEKCPQFCNGDRNATYTDCPSRCFTCNKANAICTKECRPKGCQCNTGYYRTDDGICVLPQDCPPIPCGRNETYAKCQFSCPTNYCPRDDSLIKVACLPPDPCLGGCVCNRNYLRTNDKEERCILASECPPMKCRRENEEWNSCPAPCFSDQCRDLKQAVCSDTGRELSPRCVCKYNYRRDDSGKCIAISQCPSDCGENEEPSECSDNYPRPGAGDAAVEGIRCAPGCRCKKGYKRNSKGVCVLAEAVCGKYEETNFCIALAGIYCPSCRCKKGYKYDSNGECVLDLQCGKNEEALHCKRFCPSESCSSDATRLDCKQPVECEPGCNCKKGYKRDENGICIPEEKCPQFCNGDRNATYTDCPSRCFTCNKANAICTKECRPKGCQCNTGYYRTDDGICVLPQDCPPIPCGRNETYVKCHISCPTNYCPRDDSLNRVECSAPDPCLGGCVCNRNYLRTNDKQERCILASECPPVKCTRKNEIWNPCPPACFSDYCGSKEPTTCNTVAIHQCTPQCVCIKEYRRDVSTNECIPEVKCPPVCGDNEEPSECGDNNPRPVSGDDIAVEGKCQPGCRCMAGYTRNSKGVCVLTTSLCGENEQPNVCPAIYPSDCPPCVCIKGYTRNKDGKCVKTPKCGINEVPNECALLSSTSNKPVICQPCRCAEGYNRDDYGKCVRVEVVCRKKYEEVNICIALAGVDCPPCRCIKGYKYDSYGECVLDLQCRENEEASHCKQFCPPDTCSSDPTWTDCRQPAECEPGCNCKKGYKRDDNGVCILEEKCPQFCNGDRNATYKDCPSRCNTCNKANAICTEECRPKGCQCNDGYVLNDDGICILPHDCPPLCGENEQLNVCPAIYPSDCPPCICIKGYTRNKAGKCVKAPKCGINEVPNECALLSSTKSDTSKPVICQPCRCAEGYNRDDYGKCVRGKENIIVDSGLELAMLVFFVTLAFAAGTLCQDEISTEQLTVISRPRPLILCPENEIWVKCKTVCPPQSCNILYTTYGPCDPNIKCEPGCDCQEGFLRDNSGVCVPTDKCPTAPIVCGENQEPSDCSDNYSSVPKLAVCVPGCRCIEKYVRNSYDECVPIPPVLECGKNEEPAACKKVCPPLSCSWDPTRMACRPGPCRPGCNCIKGYLQNDKGVCIPEGQCPIKCPENEEYTDCYKNLDLSDPSATLTVKCRPCQCIEGYVRAKNGVCVTKEQLCEADRNTTYTLCPNRCVSTCQNPNGVCSSECREGYGCGCKPGYLLSDDKKCILPQDCPGGNPCKENQIFVYCNAGCPTLNCPENDNLGEIACDPPIYCPSGCACKKNYKWDSDKREKCILASECPPINCTRENEVWNSCPAPCFSDQCRDVKPTICWDSGSESECKPRCVCKGKYRRDDSGKCVPIAQCPSECGENEELSDCGDNFPRPLVIDDVAVERIRCLPGCRCKEGYRRNSKGVCVPIEAICGKNEEINFCIALAGIYCPPCRCIKGYKYDSNGECIPEPPKCMPFEVWNNCTRPGFTDNCNEKSSYSFADSDRCVPRCVCQQSYARNKTSGICIPIRDCPICGENERPNICPLAIGIRCDPCICIRGYIRNQNGVCVLAPKCGTNEVPNECALIPPPRSDTSILVVAEESADKIRCQPCRCADGYKRDANGTCIREEVVCGKYEEINYCIALAGIYCPPCRCIKGYVYDINRVCVPDTSCGEYEEPNDCTGVILQSDTVVAEESVDKIRCRPCRCRKNYIRNKEGKCVLNLQCGENEVPSDCKQLCPPETCNWDSNKMECRQPIPCEAGCNCKAGYKRDENGICIPEEKCPPISLCGKNEEPNICPVFPYPRPVTTDVAVIEPVEKIRCRPCRCKKGFEYNINGTCVQTILGLCGENEQPNICLAIYPSNCPPCVCIEGYTRDKDGKCVKVEVTCGKKYEEVNFCIAVVGVDCPPCRCSKGYKYDSYGECVPDTTCGEYEEPNDCTGVILQSDTVVAQESVDKIRCRPCRCRKNYIRNKEGKCVLNLQCGENEEAAHCKQLCPPDTCSWDPTRMDCIQLLPCEAGCNCKKGYKRDDNGICIPEEKCPQFCKGDRNATYTDCPSRCFTCNKANAICTKECRPKGCQCKDGYVLNDDGICILPQDCPSIPCGRNETYAQCKFGCPTNYCPRDDSIFQVACLPPWPCPGGCVCQPKYLRTNDKEERCILATDCPTVNCTRKNEIWNRCPSACFSEYCGSEEVEPENCFTLVEHVCKPRCVCRKGYRRNSSYECIPKDDCPAVVDYI
ncbi:zonadhesin [Bicyclus anynana]|uniref:Zonadhesin n=1 Tax=Bicyclus anynana TaxID=110368 RepID=A0ABM3LLP4_BICAN|nr:zonadhesin [Bicyclus anynana]